MLVEIDYGPLKLPTQKELITIITAMQVEFVAKGELKLAAACADYVVQLITELC